LISILTASSSLTLKKKKKKLLKYMYGLGDARLENNYTLK